MSARDTDREQWDLRQEIADLKDTIAALDDPGFGPDRAAYLAKLRFRLQACEARLTELERPDAQGT